MISKSKRRYLVRLSQWTLFAQRFGKVAPEQHELWERWMKQPIDIPPPPRVNFTIQDRSNVVQTPEGKLPLYYFRSDRAGP